MAGDFNARHTSWCGANNAAGSSLNDQLVQLDTHILMNTPHVSTTVHDTVIDLSLVSNEMAANTYWSIYPGFVSDHLAVLLTIVNTRPPDSIPRPKRWLLELADWDKYKDELQERSAEMEWHGDLEVNEQQLVAVILQAAEIAIPKSTGAASNRPYWRNNHGVMLARRTYNVALKKYRRNPLPELHRDLQEAHNSYAEVCRLVRNASWDKWITEINTTPNVRDMWRRIRSASGTTPRPPTHPEPDMEAARLCVEFTDRSSAQNLPLSTQLILADLAPMREAHINAAIQEEHQTDRAFNLSELEMVLDGLHDTAPGADTVSYSMIKNAPPWLQTFATAIDQSVIPGRKAARSMEDRTYCSYS